MNIHIVSLGGKIKTNKTKKINNKLQFKYRGIEWSTPVNEITVLTLDQAKVLGVATEKKHTADFLSRLFIESNTAQ